MNPLLLTDFYKVHHYFQYQPGMTKLYSNLTPRKSRMPGVDKVVFFGLQHFIINYLGRQFDHYFFHDDKDRVIATYKKHIPVDTKHIEALWDLGYLPIEIKALSEGTLVPIGVPCLTITNTHPDFAWLVNYLETLMSAMLWQSITSATIAYEYKKLLTKYALETTGSSDFVQWQGHDFSMRGMSSVESAILSGMGHLLSFTGTDTIPAIYQLEQSYNAEGLIGASVPATEHSVMCMGTKEDEIGTFSRLLDLYPKDILSVVSDTWNLWDIVGPGGILVKLKDKILARDGKLVIRPDSGDPVKILTGYSLEECHQDQDSGPWFKTFYNKEGDFDDCGPLEDSERKGVIELLWDLFGGTYVTGNDGKQYKQLDSHIGAIYGDSITLERAGNICKRLQEKGFASTNVVLGIGSYTYQYNTRDTFGFAIKATYGEVTLENNGITRTVEQREIFKDPITDDGTKRSKKGLLRVIKDLKTQDLIVIDQCTKEEEETGLLDTVFKDGVLVQRTTLEEIRNRIKEAKN